MFPLEHGFNVIGHIKKHILATKPCSNKIKSVYLIGKGWMKINFLFMSLSLIMLYYFFTMRAHGVEISEVQWWLGSKGGGEQQKGDRAGLDLFTIRQTMMVRCGDWFWWRWASGGIHENLGGISNIMGDREGAWCGLLYKTFIFSNLHFLLVFRIKLWTLA